MGANAIAVHGRSAHFYLICSLIKVCGGREPINLITQGHWDTTVYIAQVSLWYPLLDYSTTMTEQVGGVHLNCLGWDSNLRLLFSS